MIISMTRFVASSFIVSVVTLLTGCTHNGATDGLSGDLKQRTPSYVFSSANFNIEFDSNLESRVVSKMDATANVALGRFKASEYVEVSSGELIQKFAYQTSTEKTIKSELGAGRQAVLTGLSATGLQKSVALSSFDEYPSMVFYVVSYTNTTGEAIKVTRWVNNDHALAVSTSAKTSASDVADFWSYEGASYEDRRDWVKPLTADYEQKNYMGMNASDYGSGTAIVDVWHRDVGIAVGHSETTPKLVSLPLRYTDPSVGAELNIELEKNVTLEPGASMSTLETFVTVHEGDYYATLKQYRQAMAAKGLSIAPAPDSAYEPIWCAWGYERDFNVDEILATLPKAKELGLEWAVLDDGWQTAEGDWYLNPEKFPNGDADMQGFVKKINDAGLKAKLWWAPLAVDPGTDLLHEHSDMLLLDENGAVHDITWWNSFYLCPAYEGTRQYTKALVKKMMGTWGYAGLKIDGQHLNGVPACHNPVHKHESPQDSVEQLVDFWKLIYDTALEINPDAVVEICPCGTSYAFHNLPFMNQPVSSDPLSSWQVRHKGKTLKGLMGESAPYYGDHVELSDNASDFASSMGIGAVLGTKFTLGVEDGPPAAFLLDKDKERTWAKWIGLYNQKMLPKGTYLGELYDIGFDRPEAHAIEKEGRLYYAFYADDWNAAVELRGLASAKYRVNDYINNAELGFVDGPTAQLKVEFKEYLLLELVPVDQQTQVELTQVSTDTSR